MEVLKIKPSNLDTQKNMKTIMQLASILDIIGERSSKAQELRNIITNATKFHNSTHVIYMLTKDIKVGNEYGKPLGFLKIGYKTLYVLTNKGTEIITPACILDFYVYENCQNQGYGKILFDFMLKDTQLDVTKLCYDAPSIKLINFLKKHYGIDNLVVQANNYCIPADYFPDKSIVSDQKENLSKVPPTYVVRGRSVTTNNQSTIGNIIHGFDKA